MPLSYREISIEKSSLIRLMFMNFRVGYFGYLWQETIVVLTDPGVLLLPKKMFN